MDDNERGRKLKLLGEFLRWCAKIKEIKWGELGGRAGACRSRMQVEK